MESVRDYAFDELPAPERAEVERHLSVCESCQEELRTLQLTASALRNVPDREIPQRIAFVSDKVFEPSRFARFLSAFWNSAAKLGFVSACILAAAIVFSAMHHPVPVQPTATQETGYSKADIDGAIRDAVAQVRKQDEADTKLALARVEQKYEEKQRALMISVDENLQVLQKRLSSYTMLASADASRMGGQ